MPSFFSSTLSLAFIVCVIASLIMVFLNIEPNQTTFGVVTAVISAYLARYWTPPEPKANTVTITDTTGTQESIDNVKDNISKVSSKDREDIHALTSLNWG